MKGQYSLGDKQTVGLIRKRKNRVIGSFNALGGQTRKRDNYKMEKQLLNDCFFLSETASVVLWVKKDNGKVAIKGMNICMYAEKKKQIGLSLKR